MVEIIETTEVRTEEGTTTNSSIRIEECIIIRIRDIRKIDPDSITRIIMVVNSSKEVIKVGTDSRIGIMSQSQNQVSSKEVLSRRVNQ